MYRRYHYRIFIFIFLPIKFSKNYILHTCSNVNPKAEVIEQDYIFTYGVYWTPLKERQGRIASLAIISRARPTVRNSALVNEAIATLKTSTKTHYLQYIKSQTRNFVYFKTKISTRKLHTLPSR